MVILAFYKAMPAHFRGYGVIFDGFGYHWGLLFVEYGSEVVFGAMQMLTSKIYNQSEVQ